MSISIDCQCSQILFIYPYLFDPIKFDEHVQAISRSQWRGKNRMLRVWEQEYFSNEDLLPHVANYLNSEKDLPSTARIWTMTSEALRSPNGGFGAGAKESNVQWELVYPKGRLLFDINCIDLILFRIGVGFVTLHTSVKSPQDQHDAWFDFLHYFRFSGGQRDVKLMASRRIGERDPNTRLPIVVPFYPELMGGIEHHPDGVGILDDLIECALSTGVVESNCPRWWKDVYIPHQLLPYAIIYLDDISEEEIPSMLYRTRNFFHSKQEINPSIDDLRYDHPSLINYTNYQWFFFTLEGGGFLACNSPDNAFFRTVLPSHIERQYYLLFLLTLHQRFAFMMLLDQVAENWPTGGQQTSPEDYRKAFERIRNQLLLFIARGYFAQTMQRGNHHRCYLKWQEMFQLERMYQEINEEIQYMYECLQEQYNLRLQKINDEQRLRTEELEKRLNLIAWYIGVPALVLAYLDAIGGVSWLTALYFLLGGLVLSFSFRGLISFISNRQFRITQK